MEGTQVSAPHQQPIETRRDEPAQVDACRCMEPDGSTQCDRPRGFASPATGGAGRQAPHSEKPPDGSSVDPADPMPFRLDDAFIAQMRCRPSPFGDNVLGEYVYLRTYSRDEDWWQTVRRVVEGTYSILMRHTLLGACWSIASDASACAPAAPTQRDGCAWNAAKMQRSAQRMYELIFEQRFLPPGRGLWAMGTELVHKKRMAAALNNCAFVSTDGLRHDPCKPFAFLMDASMLGVGVGFDTMGAGQVMVRSPARGVPPRVFVVPDTREGWVESVAALLRSYMHPSGGEAGEAGDAGDAGDATSRVAPVEFDYSAIRPAGVPLRTFGGIASGPGPLRELHERMRARLDALDGRLLDSTAIVDLFNLIGRCVVAGNVRRTAEIAFGRYDDDAFLDLKNYDKNPHRAEFGWTSNNSVLAELGMDYEPICRRIVRNGEPGLAWLHNMRGYSRMDGSYDGKDLLVKGANPCSEQSLESYELCCLVETFPAKHASLREFIRTLKYAFLYAKTVALLPTHWPDTNAVMARNRRIGCSVSGVAQFLAKRSINDLRVWLDVGYRSLRAFDERYSQRFGVPCSIKITSVKPSGTVSLLAGATPGMHYPEARHYIRRVRDAKDSPLVAALREAGYHVEPCVGLEHTTAVVEIPVALSEPVRVQDDVSMWEQLLLAAFLQEHWSDNQVSCTVTFDPRTEGPNLRYALDHFQYRLKSVSFLPKLVRPDGALDHAPFPQMPYERISASRYDQLVAGLQPVRWPRSVQATTQRAAAPAPAPPLSCSAASLPLPLPLLRSAAAGDQQTCAHADAPDHGVDPSAPPPFCGAASPSCRRAGARCCAAGAARRDPSDRDRQPDDNDNDGDGDGESPGDCACAVPHQLMFCDSDHCEYVGAGH